CIGELFVGGPGLALGYLNQPELTAERFVENPFYDEAQAGSSRRLYRTGDLVRYLPDGRIEFIGRVDSQVKIRGFRIELGEVEACLHAASSVASALAIVKDIAGEKQLIGYVQRQSGLDIDESSWLQALKAELQQDLPEHMIPSILIAVDEWPLTANGKVDRRALPSADVGCLQGEYVSPEGDIEQQLAGIWAQLLGIKAAEISATANFFTL
ncbi:AMP-binding protein, partial [Pseudoalteromonas sp. JC3]